MTGPGPHANDETLHPRLTVALVLAGVYYVRVAALNACGTGPISNEVTFSIDSAIPEAPIGFAATVGPTKRNRLGTDAAKLFCSTAAKEVADNAIQTLGGYGYCAEYRVEQFWRDAKLNEIGGGTLEAHQKNITRDLTRG